MQMERGTLSDRFRMTVKMAVTNSNEHDKNSLQVQFSSEIRHYQLVFFKAYSLAV